MRETGLGVTYPDDEARKLREERLKRLTVLHFLAMKNGIYRVAGAIMRIRDQYIIGVATRDEEEWDDIWRTAQRRLNGSDGA